MKQLAILLLLSVITLKEYQCLQLDTKANLDSNQKSSETLVEKQELKEANQNQQKSEIKEKTQEHQQLKTDEKQKIESKAQVKSEAKVEQKVQTKTTAKVESKAESKQKVETKAQSKTEASLKSKVEEKIQTKSKVKSKTKNKNKSKTDSDKTISERAQEDDGDGVADDHVTKSELSIAAEQIAATEDEDLMEAAGLDREEDEEPPKKEAKKEAKPQKKETPKPKAAPASSKKQSLVQSKAKAEVDEEEEDEKAEETKEEKPAKKGKEEKKEEGKEEEKKDGKKSVNQYANDRENHLDWATASQDLGFEDNESEAAKGHKVYKNMIKRFLPHKAQKMIEETEEEEDARQNDWANDKKDDKGEKEGLIPGDHEIEEAKYSNDYDWYRYANSYDRDLNSFQGVGSKNGTKGAKGAKKGDAKKGKEEKAEAKEDIPAELKKPAEDAAAQQMADLREQEENEEVDLDASTNLQLKAKNTKMKKSKKHKDGESYVSKHSEKAKKDDGIWEDMAEIFTNNNDFQKQTKKDSETIDKLMGNKKKSKKHDKINILTEKDNVKTEKPEDDDSEEKPAKKGLKTKGAPKADDPEEDPEEQKKQDLKKEAKRKELNEDDAENEDDELKKLNNQREKEKQKDDEEAKKKQEVADEKKAAKAKYLQARDESIRLQNTVKDLEEKLKAAKEAAEKQKKLAKKLHAKFGGGSEVEAELADEELGIDPEKEEESTTNSTGTQTVAEDKPEKDSKAGSSKKASGSAKGSGASVVQFTMKGKDSAESLVSKLFKNLLIADSQIQDNNFERLYMNYKKETEENDVVKVRVITSDDRVPGLIRFVQKNSLGTDESQEMSDDIIATRLVGGSKEYINWVKEQTKHKTESSDFNETGPIIGGDQELLSTIDDGNYDY